MMIACPVTGKLVDTGVEVATARERPSSFRSKIRARIPLLGSTGSYEPVLTTARKHEFECSECGQTHVWQESEAFLQLA